MAKSPVGGREKQGPGTWDEGPENPQEGPGHCQGHKRGTLGWGEWDTPTVALLCPTLLPGTLRLHPGCSPSHSSLESSTGATLCSPQHCRVTATIQHLCCSCQDACTGWVWLWLHRKPERTLPTSTSPGTTQLMAFPVTHQCCEAELWFCV